MRLSKNKLKSNVEELQNLNTIQSDENVTLQRDKLLLTDEICDLQSKVRIIKKLRQTMKPHDLISVLLFYHEG